MTADRASSTLGIYAQIAVMLEQQKQFAVATVIKTEGSTPRAVGAKMIVHPDGTVDGTIGGGALERAVVQRATAALAAPGPKPTVVAFDLDANEPSATLPEPATKTEAQPTGMLCGGRTEVLLEYPRRPRELYIIGAGHVGLALYRLARIVGYHITVVDDRAALCTQERFPDAETICAPFDEGCAEVRKHAGAEAALVIMTHAHAHDEEVLHALIDLDVRYIGMIGSTRKVHTIYERLRAKGVSDRLLQRVRSPIGLAIGAETPAEIAVSILAELVLVERGTADDDGRPLLHTNDQTR